MRFENLSVWSLWIGKFWIEDLFDFQALFDLHEFITNVLRVRTDQDIFHEFLLRCQYNVPKLRKVFFNIICIVRLLEEELSCLTSVKVTVSHELLHQWVNNSLELIL